MLSENLSRVHNQGCVMWVTNKCEDQDWGNLGE